MFWLLFKQNKGETADMDEEITRASAGTSSKKTSSSSSGRKTSSTTSAAKRKTSSSSSAAKKKTGTSTAAKKKTGTSTAAKKKTSTSTTIRLTAAEKKLITNYRKCGTLQKQIISLIIEKVAGGVTKLDGIERMINTDEAQ